jgi:hypothetical protein
LVANTVPARALASSLGEYFMEKVAIDQLRFLDPQANAISLIDYFKDQLLLIFHRHLA